MDYCEITEQCARPEQEKVRVRVKTGTEWVVKGERVNCKRANKRYLFIVECLYPFKVKEGFTMQNKRFYSDMTPSEYVKIRRQYAEI